MRPFTTLLISLLLALLAGLPAKAAATGLDRRTVAAIKNCLAQVREVVTAQRAAGRDISCDIPVHLRERDLDEMFAVAIRAAQLDEKWRDYAQRYSPRIAKAVTNFRAARCKMEIRISRRPIVEALQGKRQSVELGRQPVTCEVTTRARKTNPLSFTLSPRMEMKNGCIDNFRLNMGDVDAGCSVCLFNRLYLATKLVSIWANHMAGNVTRTLNRVLGGACY